MIYLLLLLVFFFASFTAVRNSLKSSSSIPRQGKAIGIGGGGSDGLFCEFAASVARDQTVETKKKKRKKEAFEW